MKKRSGKFSLSKNAAVTLALAVVAVVLLGVFAWSQSHPAKSTTVTPQPSSSVPMGGHGPNTTVAAGPGHDATPSATPTTISNPSHPVSGTLASPTGSFFSTLHGCTVSSPCAEDGWCDSVPGATCYLQAIGSTTVQLNQPKTVTDNGTVELPWNTNQLSAGTWQIQAVAEKDGSTAYSDKYSFQVGQ